MAWLNGVMYVYAALVLAGGVLGYLKAGSVVSIAASTAAAIAIVVGVVLAKSRPSLGYGICSAVAASLAIFFAIRLFGGSIMPGLPAMLLSIGAFAALTIGHFKSKC